MRDKPFGAALLDVAQQALAQEIAPTLKGQQRYVALMVANAMGIVAREIEQESATAKTWGTRSRGSNARATARSKPAPAGSWRRSAKAGTTPTPPSMGRCWRPRRWRLASGSPRSPRGRTEPETIPGEPPEPDLRRYPGHAPQICER